MSINSGTLAEVLKRSHNPGARKLYREFVEREEKRNLEQFSERMKGNRTYAETFMYDPRVEKLRRKPQ